MAKLSLAYQRFTSCSGCQLMLLNCEEELTALAELVDLHAFAMASSRPDPGGALDVVLIEGAVSRPEELEELLSLRERAGTLVAVGACALTGGVNVLAGRDRSLQCARVYGPSAKSKLTFPPQPLDHFVRVDFEIPGCPPEKSEYVRVLGALLRGGLPQLPEYAVCMECRLRENLCLLLERRQACLGPVTRAGCAARCPSVGAPCEGCRGLSAAANRGEGCRLLLELGLSEREVRARMERFTGEGHENH